MEIRSALATMIQSIKRTAATATVEPVSGVPVTDTLSLATARRPMPAMAPLEGGLDTTPMLNSNHPEVLLGPGIAASTMPAAGPAHLDEAFTGAFEIFAHHQNRSGRTLHQAIVLHNPGPTAVTVELGPSAVATTSNAPFADHGPSPRPDPFGGFMSGPGDRVASAMLRGERALADRRVVLAPGETRLLHTQSVPAGNEVTSQFKLDAAGPVHAAVLFEDAPPTARSVSERLERGALLPRNPHDLAPTPPGAPGGKVYGRVSGIQVGATWHARATNDQAHRAFLADENSEQSFLINGLEGNTLGTRQVQTAPVAKRYDDTAYAAHGNYGVGYRLDLPLANPGSQAREVAIHFDTPGAPAPMSRAFRGTLAIDMPDGTTRYVHVSQKRGELGRSPLAVVTLPPGARADASVRFLYPADATPPHAVRLVSRPASPPLSVDVLARGLHQAFARLESGARALLARARSALA